MDAVHWTLHWMAGPPLEASRWPLTGSLRLGRAGDNDLVLLAPTVSRRHALLEWRDAAVWISDLGSRAGTQVNGRRLQPGMAYRLVAADGIEIGPWRFSLQPDDQARPRLPVDDDATLARGRTRALQDEAALPAQRLKLLLDFAAELEDAADLRSLGALLSRHARAGSGYERAALIAMHADGHADPLALDTDPEASALPLRLSRSLLAEAQSSGLAVLDAPGGEALNMSLAGLPLRRALAAALQADGQTLAWLYLDSGRPALPEHADAPAFCQALAQLASQRLSSQLRRDSEQARQALQREAEQGHEVQQRLLPAAEGRIGRLAYALHLQPGETIAGDLVDVFGLPGGQAALLLGDVSGSGLGAGLVMASVQAFLRARLPLDADPARALTALNRHLAAQSSGGRFVTAWLGVVNSEGRLRYVDAGHGHACLHRGDALRRLDAGEGIPLGIDGQADYAAVEEALHEADTLLLFSDGLVEQRNADSQAWGEDRLHALLLSNPQDLRSALLTAVEAHRGKAERDDDLTVLIARWDART